MELQIKAIKESQSQYAEVRDLDIIKDDMSRCVDKMSFSILEGKVETKVEQDYLIEYDRKFNKVDEELNIRLKDGAVQAKINVLSNKISEQIEKQQKQSSKQLKLA